MPIGATFGKLTTITETILRPRSDGRNRSWVEAQCECGSEPKLYLVQALKSGNTTSCGCVHRQAASVANKTHGGTRTKLYRVWKGMRARCLDTSAQNYRWYGGKGISIYSVWEDFAEFREWALQAGYSEGLELDRINSDKDYGPSNCRWVTKKQNLRNRDHVWDDELDARLVRYALDHGVDPYVVIRAALEQFLGGAEVMPQ